MSAARRQNDVLKMFYGEISAQVNRRLPRVVEIGDVLFTSRDNCQLSEAIYNLPPELCEIIYKEYLAIKLRQRAALGWNEVHEALKEAPFALKEAPFCEKQGRIVNVLFCRKCVTCEWALLRV